MNVKTCGLGDSVKQIILEAAAREGMMSERVQGQMIKKNAEIARLRREKAELVEALGETSSMMEALAVQLRSWGYESVVNWSNRMDRNAAIRSATETKDGQS